ncbi:DcuS/MalK family sensor histidine kinase [Geothrix sp. PMB-07]|uniref:DcuS/MalK family sensor histidine kinase n=1 Tax=Geothrix sp. PMB-07 TaxID=3068640 RepID=UPI002740A63D|nr:DcuS/MalK family sensor histidine kinase [Geothrix sp. PMB-07]WLT30515.1 DcuS/MalK family sensor histidine kinase [Geothrix sp. PMB-07]
MSRKRPILRLRARITLLVATVLALVLVTTGFMVNWKIERQTRESLTERLVLLSRAAAESDAVIKGLSGQWPAAKLQAYAKRLRLDAKVDYITVMDMNGIRLTHPTPAQVGARFAGGDEAEVFKGRSYVSAARGTLGLSLRAFTPVVDPENGRQIGAVAVGLLVTELDRTVLSLRKRVALGVFIGFCAGIAGAMIVAGRIKQILLGMEPAEIATLLQQRSALLQSVREGVVAVDRDMTITLVNEEATRLFALAGIHGDLVGRRHEEAIPVKGMRTVVETGEPQYDQEGDINGLKILSNRVPVLVDGRIAGAVATFRDKTEVSRLAEQLTGVRHFADALRAQTHEFMNKLHVILGLVKLGEQERLKAYVAGIAGRLDDEVGYVLQRVKDPVVAGFLLARFAAAREQAILLTLDDATSVPRCPGESEAHDIVTIVGNLLENAVEALQGAPRREIVLGLWQEEDWLRLRVEDSGPGLPEGSAERLFERGFSTKGDNRGFGLWHAARTVEARGGRLVAHAREGGGAVFEASIRLFPGEAFP